MKSLAILLFLTAATCLAQSRDPGDAWLMQNYRFAGPPAPGEIQPVSPSIMRKANFAGDFEAALAGAAQAASHSQFIGAITGQLKPPQQTPPAKPEQREPANYRIAPADRSIQTAAAVWSDGVMLHYTTRQGAHGQVRLDRVDGKRSAELNRRVR
jgi:hypothetical protein